MTTKRCRRIAVVFAALFVVVTACSSEPSSDASPAARRTSVASGDNEVRMQLIAYRPQELHVPVGTEVTWTQMDAGSHTVTSGTVRHDDSGSVETRPDHVFHSRKLARGENFAFTFEDEGTYRYFCEIHPATMSGRVDVG